MAIAVLTGDLEDGATGRTGDVLTVDDQGENAHRTSSATGAGSILQTPAGQTRSSMWARYSSRK